MSFNPLNFKQKNNKMPSTGLDDLSTIPHIPPQRDVPRNQYIPNKYPQQDQLNDQN